MEFSELETVFHNVFASLLPGGMFLFDLNTEEGYQARTNLWQTTYAIVEEEDVSVLKGSYQPEERIARLDITIFRLQGEWRRSDLTLRERFYAVPEVVEALKSTGFRDVDVYGFDGQSGLRSLTDEATKAFFLGRKK